MKEKPDVLHFRSTKCAESVQCRRFAACSLISFWKKNQEKPHGTRVPARMIRYTNHCF